MRTCPKCNVAKSQSESCMKIINARHYKNGYNIKQNELNNKHRAEKRKKINAYKSQTGCPCGEREPCCLDFHHDKGDKRYSVSKLLSAQMSWTLIENEIKKCILVYSNCHRKIHAKIYPEWYKIL